MGKMYKFINEKGEEEAVKEEEWAWGVVYKNSEEIKQFDDEGYFHQFKEIKQELVRMFVMYKPQDPSKRYDLFIRNGMQIFHFYRHFILQAGTQYETRPKVYVFGWKDHRTGATVYHYILPSGNLVIGADEDISELPIEVYTQ